MAIRDTRYTAMSGIGYVLKTQCPLELEPPWGPLGPSPCAPCVPPPAPHPPTPPVTSQFGRPIGPYSFDSRWVPPVGGAPSRHTRHQHTGATPEVQRMADADGVHGTRPVPA
jgi:hypothetical protein